MSLGMIFAHESHLLQFRRQRHNGWHFSQSTASCSNFIQVPIFLLLLPEFRLLPCPLLAYKMSTSKFTGSTSSFFPTIVSHADISGSPLHYSFWSWPPSRAGNNALSKVLVGQPVILVFPLLEITMGGSLLASRTIPPLNEVLRYVKSTSSLTLPAPQKFQITFITRLPRTSRRIFSISTSGRLFLSDAIHTVVKFDQIFSFCHLLRPAFSPALSWVDLTCVFWMALSVDSCPFFFISDRYSTT